MYRFSEGVHEKFNKSCDAGAVQRMMGKFGMLK